MSGPFDFKGQAIKDSYHRLVQIVSGNLHDGTGSLIIPPSASYAITASYAVSASHEIVKEVSSSYAETASYANNFVVQNNLTASNVSASFYYGDGSNLTGIEPFPYTGSAKITGSLVLTGSIYAETSPGSQKLVIKSSNASVNNNAHIGIGNTTNPASRNIAIGYINSPKYDSVQIGGRNVGGGIAGITIGDNAASNNSRTGTIAIGQNSNRFSNGDIAIGNSSLYNDGPLGSIGTIAIGLGAGNAQSGTQNVILGTSAARTSVGSNSIFIGYETGRNNIGDNNVILGHSAGYNVTGSNNVLLGYQAGYNLTGSNQLIIANTGSHALVTGDFANNTFNILGSVSASTYYGDGSNLTGIEQTDISALNTFTGSIQTSVNTLTAATSSYNTSTANVTLDTSTLIMTDVSAEITSAESQSIDTTPTSSNAIFYNYVLENYQASGSNRSSRAGNLILINDGTNVNLSDYTVTALGNGDDPYFSASIEDTNTNLYLKDGQSYHFKAVKQHFVAPTSSVELPSAGGANVPLLDTYTGATVAYSLRKLSSTYAGSAIRIRRDSDNAETDIGFSSDGGLDTDAISTHCGSNLGYVVTWYDQSGNNRDAEQTTHAQQPLIYSQSAIITENSKPCMKFDQLVGFRNNQGIFNQPLTFTFVANAGQAKYAQAFDSFTSTNRIFYTFGNFSNTFGAGSSLNHTKILNTQILTTAIANTTSSSLYINGEEDATGSIGTNSYQLGSIGVSNNTAYNTFPKNMQEFIIWNTNQINNRTNIETNINNYYSIYDTGLLVDYPGATAAYSVRQLATTYTGDAMDIRRASDNTEQTIGFTSTGDLDTNTIETFCSGTECYVALWYDQSGNNRNAEENSVSLQPLIYSASAVITENNKPAIDFTGNPGFRVLYARQVHSQSHFCVAEFIDTGHGRIITQTIQGSGTYDWTGTNPYIPIVRSNTNQVGSSAGGYKASNSVVNNSQNLFTSIHSGVLLTNVVNNTSIATAASILSSSIELFQIKRAANQTMDGTLQEYILYDNNQLSNRTAIETNINDYFDIY